MGRNCDSSVVNSSIALLRERFRQLERAKEMRQHRDLLRLFSEPEPAKAKEPPMPFFHSEVILPSREKLQGPLYVQPNLQNKQMDLKNNEKPNLGNLWPRSNSVMHNTNNFGEPEVDTSLHL